MRRSLVPLRSGGRPLLELQHADALIAHGFVATAVMSALSSAAPDIALAATAGQCCHDSVIGQGLSDDGTEALAPWQRADV